MNKSVLSITCQELTKIFHDSQTDVCVLNSINAAIYPGDEIAIVGSSGSGKTTLLQLLGGLDSPTSGQILWNGTDIAQISANKMAAIRNDQLGFVYQFHHLLPEFTAIENVSMPLRIRRMPLNEAMQKAADILTEVGLEHRLHHLPTQLSGGERQRVAIARAMVHDPAYILADEPTGNLDRKTAESVFGLLKNLREKRNAALLIVTHDPSIAESMKHQWALRDGQLIIER